MAGERGRGDEGAERAPGDASGRDSNAAESKTVSRRGLLSTAGTVVAGSVAAGVAGATGNQRASVIAPIDGAASALASPDHPLDSSPGSQFAPHDGFAAADWFDDTVDVIKVTNLENSGSGSLRSAVEQSGPRLIVFEVSGTIDLSEDRLTIGNDKCWIAGQTAPSPGITLTRADLRVDANDCVVQHIRVRPGDAGNDSGWEPDGLRTSDGTVNNIVDHCTVSWSVDENISPGYNATDTTFSNCIAAEPLHDSSHPKGPHGYGMLVGNGATGNAILGNLFTHNVRRNIRLKVDTEAVVLNNVFDNFDAGTNMDEAGSYTIEGNGYQRGTDDDRLIEGGAKGGEQPTAYLADNWATYDTELTNGQIDRVDSRPVWPSGLEALRPGAVRSHTTVHAGARPADRTAGEKRHVDHVRNATGSIVDSQDDVGGYPSLAENTHSLDVPAQNLGDWLYAHTRVVEPDVSDYAADDGTVTTRGLRTALGDWRSGDIDTPLLREVIAAW